MTESEKVHIHEGANMNNEKGEDAKV